MSRLDDKQEQVMQAVGQVAQLGGFKIKKVTVADDLENVTLTVIFSGVSQGWYQDSLDFDREDLRVRVDGRNGHVEAIDRSNLKTGDLAETGAEADAEIAAAEALKDGATTVTIPAADRDDEQEHGEIHLVGEAAAAARKRRS